MSVYLPRNSSVWHFDFVIKGRRYHGSTGVLNRRAAEAVERKKRVEAAMGLFGQVAEMTIDAACGRYWTEHGSARGDADTLEFRLDMIVALFGKATRLREIGQAETAAAIEQLRGMPFTKGKDRIMADGTVRKAKEYIRADSTVNRTVIDTLRPVLRRARTHWTATGTPHGLPEIDWRQLRLTEPRALSRLYTAEERSAWLARVAEDWGDDLDLFLDLMMTNGLRYSEAFIPLDAPDLNPVAPTLKLQKGRKRDVILYVPLRQDHARRLAARIGRAREKGLEHPWFYAKGKKFIPYTYAQVEYRLNKAADDVGINGGRRIHGTRHHAGSTVLKRTNNLKAVQSMLGHASISSSQRYAHVLIDDLRAAIEDEEKAARRDTGTIG